jgi:hypothetical protein
MTKAKILSVLPKLPASDLAVIKAAIEHLLAKSVPAAPQSPLFDALAALLGGKNLSYATFVKSGAYTYWEKNAPIAEAFISQHFPEAAGSKVLALAITCHLLNLLLDDLRSRKIPVSFGTASTHLGRMPEIFEVAYPGYVKSGLTYLIVKFLERGNEG